MDNCLVEYFGLEEKVARHKCANCPLKDQENCWKKFGEVREEAEKRYDAALAALNRKERRALSWRERHDKFLAIETEVIREVIKELKEEDKQNGMDRHIA